jgi:ribonuclease BN (tRNA processing enzyme)
MVETFFTFYGVRGSYPVAEEAVKKYGGNTSSLLIERGEDIIIFDAGTGIIKLGEYLKTERGDIKTIHLFITHFHLDHIMGISFFYPFSNKDYKIKIYFPNIRDFNAETSLFKLFEPPYSPIGKSGIFANLELIGLDTEKNSIINIDNDLNIESFYDPYHPVNGVMLYKLTDKNKKLVFATDVEPFDEFTEDFKRFIYKADVLIHDSQYLEKDYNNGVYSTKGYGHSTFKMAVENAIEARVKRLYLFHHNPVYSDSKLDNILNDVRKDFKDSYLAKELDKNKL